MAKFNKTSQYCYPEVLQPPGNNTLKSYDLWAPGIVTRRLNFAKFFYFQTATGI